MRKVLGSKDWTRNDIRLVEDTIGCRSPVKSWLQIRTAGYNGGCKLTSESKCRFLARRLDVAKRVVLHSGWGFERYGLVTTVIMKSRPCPQRAMLRSLAILAMSLSACAAGQAQPTKDEIRLRATVQVVVPLTRFSGQVTPVDVDPRFALSLHIESAIPAVADFTQGAVVTVAIHSPSLLFGGDATKGKIYDLSLRHRIENGKARFFGLRVLEVQAAANRTPGESDRPTTALCEALIVDALKQVDELKPGTPRAVLEHGFEEDGGLQFAAHSRYVLKKCHFIKIDVEFSGGAIENRAALPTDQVVTVSRPYLEYPVDD